MGLLDSATATQQPSLGLISSMTGTPQFNGPMDFLRSPQAMALAQGLLQAGGPSRMPTTLGQGLAQGMANMQQATKDQQAYAMNQQTMDANDIALKQHKADALANAMGSVHFAAPDQKAAAYVSALASAKRIGLDTSQWPQKYDPTIVNPMVETALTQSLGAKALFSNQIAMMKAQAELAMSGAKLDVSRQGVNTQAVLGGLPAPYPAGAGMAIANSFGTPSTPGGLAPSMSGTSSSPVQAQQPGMASANNVMPMNNATPNTTPQGVQPAGLAFPAQIAEQKKQAEDWEDYKKITQKAASSYSEINNVIDRARRNLSGAIIPTSNLPGSGYLREHFTQAGDELGKESNALQTQLVSQVAPGLGKMDIPIVNMIKNSSVGNQHTFQTNSDILDQNRFANEIAGNIKPRIIQRLDELGVHDRVKAQNIVNQVINQSGALSPNGDLDINALQKNWESAFNNILSGKQPQQPAQRQQTQSAPANNANLEAFAAHAIQNGADPKAVAQRLKSLRGQ